MARVAGVVTAAGAGRRMGTPKAEVVLDGRRLLDRAVDVLAGGGCAPVYAVVRAGTAAPAARTVVNRAPERGMRSSLLLALDVVAGEPDAADAVAVLLVDLPGVTAAAVRATVTAWRPGRVAVATYAGRRGHPIVTAPGLWRAALAAAGPDEGARRFLRGHPDLVDEVPVAGDPADLDTPEALESWRARPL